MVARARKVDVERCSATVKARPAPDGWTLEAQRQHATYGPQLEIRVACELEVGHDGAHRNGGLLWHEPPLLMIGGRPHESNPAPWLLFGETVE